MSASLLKMEARLGEEQSPEGVRNAVRGRRRRVGPPTSCPTLPAPSAERARNSTEGIPVSVALRRYRPGGLRHGSLEASPSSRKWFRSTSPSRGTRRRRKTPGALERRGGSGEPDSRYVASECFEEQGNVRRGGSLSRSTVRSLNPSKEKGFAAFAAPPNDGSSDPRPPAALDVLGVSAVGPPASSDRFGGGRAPVGDFREPRSGPL
jgi:hypothetical protein